MLEKLYRRMWKPTTGRPWTYVMRQAVSERPGRALLAALLAGAGLCGLVYWAGWRAVPVALAFWLVGEIRAHLFWDTRGAYIKHRNEFQSAFSSRLFDRHKELKAAVTAYGRRGPGPHRR